jgi:hypothetical protein
MSDGGLATEIQMLPRCTWLFGQAPRDKRQNARADTSSQRALNPRREIEVFYHASKMCQISAFPLADEAFSSSLIGASIMSIPACDVNHR